MAAIRQLDSKTWTDIVGSGLCFKSLIGLSGVKVCDEPRSVFRADNVDIVGSKCLFQMTHSVPLNDAAEQYRKRLLAMPRPFLIPRRFISNESWTKATTQDGTRYIGVFRKHEPDLSTVLTHQHVLVLGEPGAGKSMTAGSVLWHLLDDGHDIPVVAALKSYQGHLRDLLDQNAPGAVLDAKALTRTYILDGVDEIPREHRVGFQQDLRDLIANDKDVRIVLTSRQAFAAQHPEALPHGLKTFHLLDFDDDDIKTYAHHHGANPDAFRAAVRTAQCEEEIANPFVLGLMLKRYQERGQLSPIRSDNVGYVIGRLVDSRPRFNAMRQRRALRMLATACETAARNELTIPEAQRVLLEAIDFPEEIASQLLDELSHSILIQTATGISFQMRSYGEFLAAEELHDKGIDRLRELAFSGDLPIDTWQNTIIYLAEMSDTVRQYFARRHPLWLINVSPAAFTEDERTALTTELLRTTSQAGAYLIDQQSLSIRRFARLLTTAVISELRNQLTSDQHHEVANALVVLGIHREPMVAVNALRLVIADRNPSRLRYAALIALINTGESRVVDQLITFVDTHDPYHINLIDAIGSLCTPAQFPQVLPLLRQTNAGLSSTYYHFRELKSREALDATIAYLVANPSVLHGFHMDSYLQPIVDLIPDHWDDHLGASIGRLLAILEQSHTFCQCEKLITGIVTHTAKNDQQAIAVRTMITELASNTGRIIYTDHLVAPLINIAAAQWIKDHAPHYVEHLFYYLPPGPARDLLDSRTPDDIKAQEQSIAQHRQDQRQHDEQEATTRSTHQATMRTSCDLYQVLDAFVRIPKEHYPDLTAERLDWLAQQTGHDLARLDLAHSVIWKGENIWTHPPALGPLLALTDYYNLFLVNDVPIFLALRSWPDEEIANYYRKHGLSADAQNALADLLGETGNDNITRHVLTFLRQTEYHDAAIRDILIAIATDVTRQGLRTEAIERLASIAPTHPIFLTLANDQEPAISEQAFRHLVKQQHEPTLRRALATLTEYDLRSGEVPFPNATGLDWITGVTAAWAIDDLRRLRWRSLGLNVWRVTNLITATIAKINKNRAAATIEEQLKDTPKDTQQHWKQEAANLRREARIEAAQQTPFDGVISKLKGATSMIYVKVWCEGATDRPVFRKLLTDAGEHDMAVTIDFVGGWPNLLIEEQPERWLDGCREAVIIMDGDVGRKLTKKGQPYTNEAKRAFQRCKPHAITIYVLKKYGIENYFPQHACEAVLQRDLTRYFPIPAQKPIAEHFSEPQPLWRRTLDRILRRAPRSFYQKRRNGEIAAHVTLTDIEGTDIAEIINELKTKAEQSRQH
jgi:hypothetical protein